MNYLNVKPSLKGLCADCGDFLIENQLKKRDLWSKFVDQYRLQLNGVTGGYSGEYWGKMLRGGVLVYKFTQNEELFEVLTETVRDMLTTAERDGRVSTYSRDTEFHGWDMWCRKYVILSLEYYLDICRDEKLSREIISFLRGAADYIIDHIGLGEGQIHINRTTNVWFGLNSSSILEPMVRLYNITGKKRYLDFAEYIVKSGFAEGYNIVERAYENLVLPYQYGVAKAYEMMSCFEGLLEFYLVTGIEKYKTAVLNFAHAVIDSEVTVIGSCGCTHELFDHAKNRQTQYYFDIMQETCVTVTWMKFCSRLLLLTGDSIFADQIEHSFYNAYLGALNTQDKDCDSVIEHIKEKGLVRTSFAFDSYSPLIPGKRGRKSGGFQVLHDKTYFGCCVCIGSAGAGIFANHAVLGEDGKVVINFYEKGSYEIDGGKIKIDIDTLYPADGNIKIKVCSEVDFELKLRIPKWAGDEGYSTVSVKKGENEFELSFDMSIRETLPITWDIDALYTKCSGTVKPPILVKHKEEEDRYISLARGPLVLAADSRLGKDAFSEFSFKRENGAIEYRVCEDKGFADGENAVLKCEFTGEDGTPFFLINYSSAGKDWKTPIAAWLPTK